MEILFLNNVKTTSVYGKIISQKWNDIINSLNYREIYINVFLDSFEDEIFYLPKHLINQPSSCCCFFFLDPVCYNHSR